MVIIYVKSDERSRICHAGGFVQDNRVNGKHLNQES